MFRRYLRYIFSNVLIIISRNECYSFNFDLIIDEFAVTEFLLPSIIEVL